MVQMCDYFYTVITMVRLQDPTTDLYGLLEDPHAVFLPLLSPTPLRLPRSERPQVRSPITILRTSSRTRNTLVRQNQHLPTALHHLPDVDATTTTTSVPIARGAAAMSAQ